MVTCFKNGLKVSNLSETHQQQSQITKIILTSEKIKSRKNEVRQLHIKQKP